MNPLNVLGLGARLALAGGRRSLVRFALMSTGLAIGVALLLGALSVGPAIGARSKREALRLGETIDYGRHLPANVTLEWPLGTTFEGNRVLSIAVQGLGQAPTPPGLQRLPALGEVFVSPALGDLLSGPTGALLRPRVPGRVVGFVGPAGLLFPDELVAYVGAPQDLRARPTRAQVIVAFAQSRTAGQPLGATGVTVMMVLLLTTLAPIALFVLTAIRLSTATREARLAAIRLVGGTQAQIRMLAAAESGVCALIGTAVGVPLFLAGRSLVASIPIADYRWFASDFSPSLVGYALVVVGMPLLAVAVSTATMRRLLVSPLGVVRRARKFKPDWRWAAALGLGLITLTLSGVIEDRLFDLPSPLPGVFIGVAMGLCIVGLAGTTPVMAWHAARFLASRDPSPSLLLGARRLESDPVSPGRIASSVAVLVTLVGAAQGLVLTLGPDGTPPKVAALKSTQLVVTAFSQTEALRSLDQVAGVESARLTDRLPTGDVCRHICAAVLDTDGSPATLERVRNDLAWIGSVQTRSELLAPRSSTDAQRMVSLLQWGIALLLIVTGLSLLVSTVDGMLERRRSLAMLSAAGVPTPVIRRSVLVQVGLPLASGTFAGVVAALALTILVFRVGNLTLRLPMVPLITTMGVTALMIAIVTLATSPWLRIALRPELLRNE